MSVCMYVCVCVLCWGPDCDLFVRVHACVRSVACLCGCLVGCVCVCLVGCVCVCSLNWLIDRLCMCTSVCVSIRVWSCG